MGEVEQSVRELAALTTRIYKAHAERDTSDLDDIAAEAERLQVRSGDLLRRLSNLRHWKREGAK